jgi:phosphoribosylamine--glycine ligase
MGAYAPVAVDPTVIYRAFTDIMHPTIDAMRARGTPFRGLLYAGLMLTADGPKVIEFNCRFGDPETQTILPLLRGSLLNAMLAIARGEPVGGLDLVWDNRFAVTTVLASEGYPGKVRTGDEITLGGTRAGVLVFHAGTATGPGGKLVTAGGRVLALTGVAATFDAAQAASRAAAESVKFAGKQFRRDIGWREAERKSNYNW